MPYSSDDAQPATASPISPIWVDSTTQAATEIIWVDSPGRATAEISKIYRHYTVGLDTEFYGCDITKESPVGTARVHVFSVAAPTGPTLPRGYHASTAWVFSGELLTEPSVKEWIEDERITKCVHNQPVDHHAIRNSGPVLRGACNTLELARFIYPERHKRRGYNLERLSHDLLGRGKAEDFDELLGYDAIEPVTEFVDRTVCACLTVGCRKRKTGPDGLEHKPVGVTSIEVTRNMKVRRITPLTDLTPAHPLWQRYLTYAAVDAVLALGCYEIMLREGRKERPIWTSPT